MNYYLCVCKCVFELTWTHVNLLARNSKLEKRNEGQAFFLFYLPLAGKLGKLSTLKDRQIVLTTAEVCEQANRMSKPGFREYPTEKRNLKHKHYTPILMAYHYLNHLSSNSQVINPFSIPHPSSSPKIRPHNTSRYLTIFHSISSSPFWVPTT